MNPDNPLGGNTAMALEIARQACPEPVEAVGLLQSMNGLMDYPG